MIIDKKIEDLDRETILETLETPGAAGRGLHHRSTRACSKRICPWSRIG
jgi:hypothetical protein